MNTEIKIGKSVINQDSSCYIIAEAGANFRISDDSEKNYKHALKLIDIAVKAKADAVKFQLYRASKMYVETAGFADYIGKHKSIFEIIKEMEVPYEWLPKLKEYCDSKNITFLCTPFDEESADELEKIGIEAYKIASYSITHLPLLKHIAKKNKPMILSTGASNFADIHDAIKAIKDSGNNSIALLQCTAKYPAPLSSINLKAIPQLQKELGVLVGLSDHSREAIIAPMGAVSLGAKIIEKHYTTDNKLPGPDHGFAILPEELKQLVNHIRKLEKTLGNGKKAILDDEKELLNFARRFIYAKTDIPKGNIFTKENIVVLRSGNSERGLEPKYYDDIIGKKSLANIKTNQPIKESSVETMSWDKIKTKKQKDKNTIIHIRFAEKSDLMDVFDWRNEPETRKASFNTNEVDLDTHKEWFEKSLKNKNRTLFIALNENYEKIGQIRFDKKQNFAELYIAITQNKRGKGYGTNLISKACNLYLDNSDAEFLIANIKTNNSASLGAFRKAGFVDYKNNGTHIELRYKK